MRREVVAGVAGLLLVACAPPAARSGRTGAAPGFPPTDEQTLIRHFQPLVEPFGLEMTRASLIELDGYDPSPTGRHLALYAEPTGEYPVERYLGNMAPLAGTLADVVFVRWSKVESFDICQEPIGSTQESPIPITRVKVTRTADQAIRWGDTGLVELLALNLARYEEQDPDGVRVEVFGDATTHPTYLAALEDARQIAGNLISGA